MDPSEKPPIASWMELSNSPMSASDQGWRTVGSTSPPPSRCPTVCSASLSTRSEKASGTLDQSDPGMDTGRRCLPEPLKREITENATTALTSAVDKGKSHQ